MSSTDFQNDKPLTFTEIARSNEHDERSCPKCSVVLYNPFMLDARKYLCDVGKKRWDQCSSYLE